MAEKNAKPSVAVRLVGLVGFLTLAASLLAFAGDLNWRIDLLSHFRFQYVLVLTLCTATALALRAWRTGTVLACGWLVNAAVLVPLFIAPDAPPNTSATPIRLAAINVNTANRSFDTVVDYVIRAQPDVVFFQETNDDWIESLSKGMPGYRIVEQRARSDNFGVLAMIRRASETDAIVLTASAIAMLAPDAAGVPAIEMTVQWEGRPLHLLCLHTLPPVNTPAVIGRDTMLDEAAQWVNDRIVNGDRVIVMGDLNATPWCAVFRQFIDRTAMVNSSRGFGWQPTWPSTVISLGNIPIDHCLHSANMVTVRREVDTTGNGSDHFPLLVELVPAQQDNIANTNTQNNDAAE